MAQSTRLPTPNASPPKDIMFIETLEKYISAKVAITEIGIVRVTIKELQTFLKK